MPVSKQQLNVLLPADLIREVKHASVDADVSLSAFIERALRAYLRNPTPDEEQP